MKKGKQQAEPKAQKATRFGQSELPTLSLEKSLRIAQALWDSFAGKEAAPHDVALSLDLTPTSGYWRELCGASVGYGLTEGSYNAREIKLTDIGRRIVAPTAEDEEAAAKMEAVLIPRIARAFFEKYDRAKFPPDNIVPNVLMSLGVPKERAGKAVEILKENGEYVGIIRGTKTGLFVALNAPPKLAAREQGEKVREGENLERTETGTEVESSKIEVAPSEASAARGSIPQNDNVFVSHGKNREIVEQLKKILTFGKFTPVVSVERETISKPVPDKVMKDMRMCMAGVIHVSSEGEWMDSKGESHIRINENVLIEIGAAMALYENKFVLLVEKGVPLPSNLQGLYRCEYEGNKLDYEATMRLLETFNQFR